MVRRYTSTAAYEILRHVNPNNIYLYRANTMSLVTFNTHKYRVFDITVSEMSKLRYIDPALGMTCVCDGLVRSNILSGIRAGANMHPRYGIIDEEELLSPLLMRLNSRNYLDIIGAHINHVFSTSVVAVDADYGCIMYTDSKFRYAVPTSIGLIHRLRNRFKIIRGVLRVDASYDLYRDLSLILYGKTHRSTWTRNNNNRAGY